MDFTQNTYRTLLQALQAQGFSFITFGEYIKNRKDKGTETAGSSFVTTPDYLQHNTLSQSQEPGTRNAERKISLASQKAAVSRDTAQNPERRTMNSEPATQNAERIVILRHDVDLKPQNSLATAKLEHKLGIKGSYYFRAVPESWDEQIIREIALLGHEIGYHYENLTTCNGNVEKALIDFKENLSRLRQLADVKTICMHGSPKSRYDSKDLWKYYNYKDLGIIGEPYFDMDFNDFFYLTDTGRQWNGHKVSVRDKMPQQEQWNKQGLVFRTTTDIIKAANQGKLPPKIMITVHPQRWTNSAAPWVKEFFWQNFKNGVKKIIVSRNR